MVNGRFNCALTNALRRLEKNGFITYRDTYKAYSSDCDFVVLTEEQSTLVNTIKKDLISELGYTNEYEALIRGKDNKFYKELLSRTNNHIECNKLEKVYALDFCSSTPSEDVLDCDRLARARVINNLFISRISKTLESNYNTNKSRFNIINSKYIDINTHSYMDSILYLINTYIFIE